MAQVEHHDHVIGKVYHAGDQPGAGIYRCVESPDFVAHLEDGETLPDVEIDEGDTASYLRVVDERDAVPPESESSFPNAGDEAVDADPLKRSSPETKQPGERLQDYLG